MLSLRPQDLVEYEGGEVSSEEWGGGSRVIHVASEKKSGKTRKNKGPTVAGQYRNLILFLAHFKKVASPYA